LNQPTVALFPEPGAWGPTNNLVALGNHLRERGIRTVFVVEESFEGELAARGFEAFTFGVPTIVLPLFWDQYDNAQRIDECGYGIRLSTYEFADDELHGTIDRLGDDQQLAKRLAAASSDCRPPPDACSPRILSRRSSAINHDAGQPIPPVPPQW
jgi:UDP:flavonoid glycosyltransferase YjiC (YdhE family)